MNLILKLETFSLFNFCQKINNPNLVKKLALSFKWQTYNTSLTSISKMYEIKSQNKLFLQIPGESVTWFFMLEIITVLPRANN